MNKKDMEKSLKLKCLTWTNKKTRHNNWTLNLLSVINKHITHIFMFIVEVHNITFFSMFDILITRDSTHLLYWSSLLNKKSLINVIYTTNDIPSGVFLTTSSKFWILVSISRVRAARNRFNNKNSSRLKVWKKFIILFN